MNNPLKFFGIACLACGCHSNPTTPAVPTSPINPVGRQASASLQATKQTAPIFDIHTLLKLPVSQIKARLGQPLQEEQSNASGTQRYCKYLKGGYSLTINYSVATNMPDLFFFVNDKRKTSFSTLLAKANLDSTAAAYTVEYSVEPTIKDYPGLLITLDSSASR